MNAAQMEKMRRDCTDHFLICFGGPWQSHAQVTCPGAICEWHGLAPAEAVQATAEFCDHTKLPGFQGKASQLFLLFLQAQPTSGERPRSRQDKIMLLQSSL